MSKKIFTFLIIIFLIIFGFLIFNFRKTGKIEAQAETTFFKVIGGAVNDYGYSVAQTTDGGYIVAGYTSSFGAGANDALLLKFDSTGNLSWAKTLGETSGDYGYSVAQTTDGGYIVAGYTFVIGGSSDILLSKFDSAGNNSWTRVLSGTDADRAESVVQTSDGGYLITGWTDTPGWGNGGRDALLAKFDSNGSYQWTKVVGKGDTDQAYSGIQTSDGGYIITGYTRSWGAGMYDVLLLKLDSSFNLSRAKAIGGAGSEYGYSVAQTTDGGYIVAGYTDSSGAGMYDVLLLKLDSSFNLSWAKTIGGAATDRSYSVAQTTDGGYIVAGDTSSFGAGGSDVLLLKFDSTGNLSWAKAIGEAGSEYGYSVAQTTDGGYIITGVSWVVGNPKVLLLRTDSNGNISDCPPIASISPAIDIPSLGIFAPPPPPPSVKAPAPTISSPSPTVITSTPTITDICPAAAFPSAPTVSTLTASDITSSQATLNGEITATGGENASERGFEWGTTSGGPYPNPCPNPLESGNFGTGPFSCNLSGLTLGQTYYFRAKAKNSVGWGYGGEMSFTTLTDCGLRVFDGTSVIAIACEPTGTLTSLLRIRKGGTTYGIILVPVTDANASKIRIQTSSGIKALRKY